MDDVDRHIIAILLEDGRASFSAIGREVGLSTNATASRVRRLETSGAIRGYRAILGDGDAGGSANPADIEAFIDVRLNTDRNSDDFLEWARARPEVIDAAHVTGPYDFHVHIRVSGMPALDALLRAFKTEAGVAQTQTRIALR